MLLSRIEALQSHVRAFVRSHFDLALDEVTVEFPPDVQMGDLALPFPFHLARELRKAPGRIAQEVVDNIGELDNVLRFEVGGGGYVNAFLDRASFFAELGAWLMTPFPQRFSEKVIVEHTNINPNKAAHIGHLRNAVLGDSLVRLLRAAGFPVEVQNYIDNTGVQVADVVVGFHHLREMDLQAVAKVEEPFDYYCWNLYAEVSEWYAANDSRLQYRNQVLQALEQGSSPLAELAEHVAGRIVRAHLKTMARIGVRYDLLPRESEILHLKFWEEAFELLKARKAIRYQKRGSHAGCWVMSLPELDGRKEDDKIIVRSDGTVTYVGKDIAYQLWKFGRLEKTFNYDVLEAYPDGQKVWVSTARQGDDQAPSFGGGSRVYNVIDARQAFLQRVVTHALRSLGFEDEADHSIHFSYEMVALSPRCCRQLGIDLSEEDRQRPYVEVSGRKGLGIKADELVDRLIALCTEEVQNRQKELPEKKRIEIAEQIAVGALRYFMLKYTRNSVIAFDFSEVLSFEGETGPYLQYSVVRSENILRKGIERKDQKAVLWSDPTPRLWSEASQQQTLLQDADLWTLISQIGRVEYLIVQAVDSLEPSLIAKHAFTLAQQFNFFYHHHHILSEPDDEKRGFYLAVVQTTRLGLVKLLDLLGVEVPERM